MVNLYVDDGYAIREQINKYRIKHNIPEPNELKNIYNRNGQFLEEELGYVTSLRITPTIIDYIDYFHNLKSITFDSSKQISNKDIQTILNKCPNLEYLTINEQNTIISIDVSHFSNL